MKTTLSLATAILICSCFSYAQIITFTGIDSKTGQPVKIDSIQIQNLTQKRDTTLIGTNQIDLSVFTDVGESVPPASNQFSISQNYPNSFADETKFSVNLPYSSNFKIMITNELGQTIAGFNNYFETGNHQFLFKGSSLPNGIYIISVDNGNALKSIKIIKYGETGAGENLIEYLGNSFTPAVFNPGDRYNFTGYAFGYYKSKLPNILPTESNYEFVFQEPVLPSYFSNANISLNYGLVIHSGYVHYLELSHLDYGFSDSAYFQFNSSFIIPYNQGSRSLSFCGKTITLTCEAKYDLYSHFNTTVNCTIDTSKKIINSIQVENSDVDRPNMFIEDINSYSFHLSNISCVLKYDGNKFYGEIKGKELSSFIIDQYYGSYYWGYASRYQKTFSFNKIISTEDDCYLKIELYP